MVTAVKHSPKPLPLPPPTFDLNLSEEEASVLLLIMDSVGGDPVHSLRRHTDAIGRALRSASVKSASQESFGDRSSICFNNEG